MPSARRGKLKPSELRAAFQNDLAAAWKRARELHPDHTPYAFVLYGVEGTPHLMPVVLTEESLTQIAQRELDITSCYDTLAEARHDFRYGVPDSPFFSELLHMVPSVNALMAPYEESLDEAKGYELLAKAAMDAFEALDKEGLFGTGQEREQLLLAIITQDLEKDWSLPSAKRLNPPTLYRRFEVDTRVTGKFVSSEAVAVSPDGRSVYSAGTREINPKKQVSEIVAYDRAGLRLKRRWNFSFPGFGDSGRRIACASDGTMLVMRARYSGGSCETLLMRFGEKSKEVLAQTQVRGEPATFALARDGSRVAVILHDKTLHVLNDRLEVQKEIKWPLGGFRAAFLRSGDLLVTTGSNGILRVDTSFGITPAYQGNSFNLSIDDAEKLAVVSRWYRPSPSGGAENVAFSVEVLGLPDWTPLRTISIPGHQCVSAVISPDGSRVAFEAHEIGTYRTFISVRETASGRELARRKSLHLKALTFLPDNRTLAIAACDRTPSEPVWLWAVPDL